MQIKELVQLSCLAQCVLPHSSRAQLSTPAKLINWICIHVSSSPLCDLSTTCSSSRLAGQEEFQSLPREVTGWWSCHGYPVDCGHLPLTTDCPTVQCPSQNLANKHERIILGVSEGVWGRKLGWRVEQVGSFHKDNKETEETWQQVNSDEKKKEMETFFRNLCELIFLVWTLTG